MSQDNQSQKSIIFFIASDCLNFGQQLQGRKNLKTLQNGPLIDIKKLTENENIQKNFNLRFWVPNSNNTLEKQIHDLEYRLFERANLVNGKAFYLFYSGISFQNGDWAISQKGSIELKRISLTFIIQKWQKLKQAGEIRSDLKLIIFLDSSYSGMWCWKLITLINFINYKKEDICIFASAKAKEKTVDIQGGLFFNCLFSKNSSQFEANYDNLVRQKQVPIYIGPQIEYPMSLSKDEISQMNKNLSNSFVIGFNKKQPKESTLPFPFLQKTIISNNNYKYTGEAHVIKNRVYKWGYGKYQFRNGQHSGVTYEGYWSGDSYQGKGVLTKPDGYKYEGNFEQGQYFGFGKETISNGQRYEGIFNNSRRHGEGFIRYQNGDVYLGAFKKDKKQGYGSYKYTNGDRYDGYWKNDLRDGFGLYLKADGTFYEGDWKNDLKNGLGYLYVRPIEKMFRGRFVNDKKHGQFVVDCYQGKDVISQEKMLFINGKIIQNNIIEQQRSTQALSEQFEFKFYLIKQMNIASYIHIQLINNHSTNSPQMILLFHAILVSFWIDDEPNSLSLKWHNYNIQWQRIRLQYSQSPTRIHIDLSFKQLLIKVINSNEADSIFNTEIISL